MLKEGGEEGGEDEGDAGVDAFPDTVGDGVGARGNEGLLTSKYSLGFLCEEMRAHIVIYLCGEVHRFSYPSNRNGDNR